MLSLIELLFIWSIRMSRTDASGVQPSFQIDHNVTHCPMYSKSCLLPVHVSDSAFVNQLKISGLNEQLVQLKSVKSCDYKPKAKTTDDCLRFAHNEKNVILIYWEPRLVGKLEVNISIASSSLSHTLVISKPERLIDTFLDVYIVVFTVLIAVLMGVLLDWEIIKKITYSPAPVIIGKLW